MSAAAATAVLYLLWAMLTGQPVTTTDLDDGTQAIEYPCPYGSPDEPCYIVATPPDTDGRRLVVDFGP